MSEPHASVEHHHAEAAPMDPAFAPWRRTHRTASGVLGVLALAHAALTLLLYDAWSPDAVWFLGTGLGLLLLSVAAMLVQAVSSHRTLRRTASQAG